MGAAIVAPSVNSADITIDLAEIDNQVGVGAHAVLVCTATARTKWDSA